MPRLLALTLLVSLLCTTSCARKREPLASQAQLSAAQYPTAFQAAKDELRRLGFRLDRVDARAGVITTEPRSSAGWASLWERQETTGRQETENLLHRQRRKVEVAFSPAPDQPAAPDDLRTWEGDVQVDVRVGVDRIYRFGVRIMPVSIRLSSVARDPELARLGAQPGLAVVGSDDQWLAGRITDAIARQMADGPVAPAG